MALWTDIIDPAQLTGYARAAFEDYEENKGTLARWLPNREVADISVRFIKGQTGLIPEAKYRAYDAAPNIGKSRGGQRVILELPALSETQIVSEYDQIRNRNSSDAALEKSIFNTTRRVVHAIADRAERLRGIVLNSGRATIPELASDDNFGRSPSNDVTAPVLWADPDVDRIGFLEFLVDQYRDVNGVDPGSILMPAPVYKALAAGKQFKTQLLNGISRPPAFDDVKAIIDGVGLPPLYRYDRRTGSGRVLDSRKLMLLPAPVDANDWEGTELGATFWGQTLTATDERYDLDAEEMPGIVTGVYRAEKPPLIAEVTGDSINLPVLANADLSLSATVLA
ncbi:major capsid protein [Microbacterium sp. KSW2-21]|uniref:Major capsid protein n=1 Tax=Microbacterium algihabitans TaxID=3075992 RepID=A0ABU3RWG1_9MICO|nr:major capsid protein [Microbacterium sp. KSW2-21]MDU0327217.1 major capsid protein [Microbacterium sp. KSW2-21]